MKKVVLPLIALFLCLSAAFGLFACEEAPAPAPPPDTADDSNNSTAGIVWNLSFQGDQYTADEAAAITQNGNVVLLTRAGTYRVSGTLNDGQLRVRVAKTEKVTLIFDNFTAACSTSAPVYIESADKITVELADGTTNTLSDTPNYVFSGTDTKPNACLYSSEDITLKGNGTLIVNAAYNNGIGSKNDLKIKSGTYHINAVKNALKGNDSVTVEGGSILIHRCNDGIKTDATEVGRGVLTISSGNIEIHAEDDALQASQSIDVTGGKITVEALGKVTNCDGTVNVADGIIIEQ